MKTPVRSRIFLPDLPICDPGVPVDTICEFERIDATGELAANDLISGRHATMVLLAREQKGEGGRHAVITGRSPHAQPVLPAPARSASPPVANA